MMVASSRASSWSAPFVMVTGLVLVPASIYAAGELRGSARSFTVMLLLTAIQQYAEETDYEKGRNQQIYDSGDRSF